MSEGKRLLERLLSSRTKGELLQLFHRNPGLVDTPEGVARRIGRSAPEIEAAVDDLVDMGVLQRRQIGALQTLSYDKSKDEQVQSSVEAYIKSLPK